MIKQIQKKLVALLLAIIMVISICPYIVLASQEGNDIKYDENKISIITNGEGTIDNPYQISNTDDMWYLAGHSEYWNSCFILTTDIDLECNTRGAWSPIGTNNGIKFSGNFNGAGNKIYGLCINTINTYQGLFGYVLNGDISNLTVEGNITAGGYTGGIVGTLEVKDGLEHKIEHCSFLGIITSASDNNSNSNIGGIVGYNHGGKVLDCKNSGTITSTSQYIGGIVGLNDGSNSIIQYCDNEGICTISGKAASAVGGITGVNRGQVLDCHNLGNVSDNNSNGLIGGIVGYNNSGTILRCFNSTDVNGSNLIGGIAGQNSASASIKECYNTANITGTKNIGGIAGQNDDKSTVTNCYNIGEVTGTNIIGGIVGQNYYGTSSKNSTKGTVSNCYDRGLISGTSNVGTIVGLNANNYTEGTVSNSYYLDKLTIGGINGQNILNKAEAKSEEVFKSGEITWRLQYGQTDLVWGQNLIEDPRDNWPLLCNTGIGTGSPRVYRVTFEINVDNSNILFSPTALQRYTNYDGNVVTPTMENLRSSFASLLPKTPSDYVLWWADSQREKNKSKAFTNETKVQNDRIVYMVVPLQWGIEVHKFADSEDGNPLSGAIFGLYSPNEEDKINSVPSNSGLSNPSSVSTTLTYNNTNYYLVDIQTTNSDGKISNNPKWGPKLKEDEYVVVELQAPFDYTISESTYYVSYDMYQEYIKEHSGASAYVLNVVNTSDIETTPVIVDLELTNIVETIENSHPYKGGIFKFTIVANEENDEGDPINELDETTFVINMSTQNKSKDNALVSTIKLFDGLEFTKEGTYKYTITQVIVDEDEFMQYDKTSYAITITIALDKSVSNSEHKLVATIDFDDETQESIIFTNIYNYPLLSLDIHNLLDGNMANMNDMFTFRLILSNDGYDLPQELKYIKGNEESGTLTTNNNVCEFTLGHNESIKFTNLPVGTTYELSEISVDDNYKIKATISSGDETIEMPNNQVNNTLNKNTKVEFTNAKSGIIPTNVNISSIDILIMTLMLAFVSIVVYRLRRLTKRN